MGVNLSSGKLKKIMSEIIWEYVEEMGKTCWNFEKVRQFKRNFEVKLIGSALWKFGRKCEDFGKSFRETYGKF